MIKGDAIHIGAKPETIKEARSAILDILKQPVSDDVKIAALGAFYDVCAVNNATISNCVIDGSGKN